MESVRTVKGKFLGIIELIKFEHSIFALPFAMIALFMVYDGRLPDPVKTFWIILAMISARSAAMAFNRIADYGYDSRNPRTSTRPLQARKVSLKEAWVFTVMATFIFVFSAAMLNRTAFWLSFTVLPVLFGYSYTKRFSALSHLILGLNLGVSAMGAWVGVTAYVAPTSILLCAGITFWVAGFDIFYALQDIEFDKKEGLISIPVRLGPDRARTVALIFHIIALAFFISAGVSWQLGSIFYGGLTVIAIILFSEHWLVAKRGLTHINMAFFTLNGVVSILFFCFTMADILIRKNT
ncbi:MAG: 4-hydroxybenzoate octaprenyltransferase [Syntrophus sp. (in: bacteria)]|nr:4-hydroxybenzoate octaprenyltransferase [Syntrophus sp. (in: bacteria)]